MWGTRTTPAKHHSRTPRSADMATDNEHLIASIVIGTVTGLISSAAATAFQQFIAKVVLPWYENLIYKDVKIEGTWDAEATIGGQLYRRLWTIERQGHRVTATIVSTS